MKNWEWNNCKKEQGKKWINEKGKKKWMNKRNFEINE